MKRGERNQTDIENHMLKTNKERHCKKEKRPKGKHQFTKHKIET